MNQHVTVFRNRLQWLSLAQAIALQIADAACSKAVRASLRGAAARQGGDPRSVARSAALAPTLPDGNHGEIYGMGHSV